MAKGFLTDSSVTVVSLSVLDELFFSHFPPDLDSVDNDSSCTSFGGVSGTDSPSPYQEHKHILESNF